MKNNLELQKKKIDNSKKELEQLIENKANYEEIYKKSLSIDNVVMELINLQ